MVSFASPLFWQIHYLVTNLSKKNFKSNVAELNQLVGLYGEDARIFLLNCLVKEIDFRDTRNQHKDALKIQLLSHEIAHATSRPNFTTFICEAIDGSAQDGNTSTTNFITEDFLVQFCKTLKLTIPQQIAVGLAFAQGENPTSVTSATAFLRSKLPELSSCGSKLSSDVLHTLLFVLRRKDDFLDNVAETDSFLASISAAHPTDMNSLEIAPLTMGDPDLIDCVVIAAESDREVVEKLAADVVHTCEFYDLMEDVGYTCTATVKEFRTLLQEAGLENAPTIPPAQVAGLLAMIARTSDGTLITENGATLMANLPIVGDQSGNAPAINTDNGTGNMSTQSATGDSLSVWNLDVIAEVLQQDYSQIKWAKVVEKLDRPDLVIKSVAQLQHLISAFQKFSKTKFSVLNLLRTWKNSRVHIDILKAAIDAPPDVISFTESPRKLAPFEGADASAVPKNGVWFSLDVVETLLNVSEKDCYGDVRRILDNAGKACPDVVIANLAHADPKWNSLRDDVFSELFSTYVMGRPNAPLILRHLWSLAPKLVLFASVKCFYAATSPQIISRLFALFRNTGDAFASAIHSNYFSFALSLAVMSANHEVINFETWLTERLTSQRVAFATSCIAFIHRNYARAIPKTTITPQSSHILSVESLAIALKCLLQVQKALPQAVSVELDRIIALSVETHPVISPVIREHGAVVPISSQSSANAANVANATTTVVSESGNENDSSRYASPGVGASLSISAGQNMANSNLGSGPVSTGGNAEVGNNTPAFTAEMIEEQANTYFQQIYSSEQSITEVVAMLKRFQSSRDEREHQIFYCMIHNLFDEYRFFPRYPEMELRITGVLFGKLIEHQVLPPNFLQTALRSVLESLREPVNSKFFFFGACALQQFVPRLHELPSYCTNLLQIPHLQHALPDIMRQVRQASRGALSVNTDNDINAMDSDTGLAGTPATAAGSLMAGEPALSIAENNVNAAMQAMSVSVAGDQQNKDALTRLTGQDPLNIQIPQNVVNRASPLPTPSPKITNPQTQLPPPTMLQVDHIFHESSIIDEEEEIVQPEEAIKDRIHFIVNNMSISNLEVKIPEVRKLLQEPHHSWFANYLVVKRISTQPNYHTVYMIFIEKLVRPQLESEILKRTLQNARKLLTSSSITTNSQQRSLLKNLGSWLGVFTLSRNKPLLQRDVDIKELLYVGYETGRLIAVTPFVAKILEGCKKSKIFKPPNPWIMGMIHAMSEIYNVPDLKLNLKFEIEVLFKSFKLNVEDQPKTATLHKRLSPPRVNNPDFNVKVQKQARSSTPVGGGGVKPMQKVSPKSLKGSMGGASLKPGEAGMYAPLGSPQSGLNETSGVAPVAGPSTVSESTVIPNLASYVAVNPELPLHNVNLRRLVPLAVDRAIREVISPVVERSVTIACITTRDICLKDFATEIDDVKMRKAAHLMVASMSGSLALITAKEPLRNSIASHLRALIPASAGDQQQIEHVIQVCSNENTDLGCMLIEKASSEKAMRDIDEALGAGYVSRRRYQQQLGSKVSDSVHFFEGESYQCPPNLPEVFKPKPGGIPHVQLVVYEAFQRIPRPTSVPMTRGGGNSNYMNPNSISTSAPNPPGADNDSSALSDSANTGGVSVAAALDRFAGLMEKFELFVQHVVRQAAASQRDIPSLMVIPPENEVFAVLREVRSLGAAVKPVWRDEACLKIGHRIVKCMYELGGGRGDELFLEILVSSLDALSHTCEKLRKEIVNWILRAPVDDKLKLHCEVVVAVVRYQVVPLSEFDLYLTRNMERNSVAIEFAVHVVRQCLVMDHVVLAKQLPHTLEALSRIVERHGISTNKNVQVLANLLEQARTQSLNSATRSISKIPAGSIGSAPGQAHINSSGSIGSKPQDPTITSGLHQQEHGAFRHTVSNALEHWIAIYKEPTVNSKIQAQYIQMLKQYGLLNDDESISLFFKYGTELCVEACLKTATPLSDSSATIDTVKPKPILNYNVVDALTHLMSLLVKYLDSNANTKLQVLNHAVGAIANVLVAAHDSFRKRRVPFDQRVFFRMFVNLMKELTTQEPVLDPIHLQVLNTFASAFNTLQPLVLPGFVFAWLELISHRCFMPMLLKAKQQRGWQILHRLLMNLFTFLEPFLRPATTRALPPSVSTLYKGTVRVILVLLHDYPDFLSDFYTSFCDVLPASCIQLRNVILSAFSRSMRLPDPLTLGLQVSQLPEVSISPRLMQSWGLALQHNNIKEYVDEFLRATSNRAAVFPRDLISKLLRNAQAPSVTSAIGDIDTCKYAIPVLNALVLYLGKEAIMDMAAGTNPPNEDNKLGVGATNKFEQSASMDIFRYLADELDAEGRYWYFSSLTNHLRYPNAHTHYFSCVILYLFSYSNNKMVKEQITRVLIERLIANRPHPWGLLVTFIELIRNKSYKFWDQDYLECSSEIKEVFDDVARTCLGTSNSAEMNALRNSSPLPSNP